VVSTHRDWLDYVSAVAGIAGLIGAAAAVVALIFARRSAGDASKSLERADASLTIQREEAAAAKQEREQRADPVLVLHAKPKGVSRAAADSRGPWGSATKATGTQIIST
jgi:hypothetical protein